MLMKKSIFYVTLAAAWLPSIVWAETITQDNAVATNENGVAIRKVTLKKKIQYKARLFLRGIAIEEYTVLNADTLRITPATGQ